MSAPGALRALAGVAGLDATGLTGEEIVAAADVSYRFDPQRTCELLAGAIRELHEVSLTDVDPAVARLCTDSILDSATESVRQQPHRTLSAAYAHMDVPRLLEVLRETAGVLEETGELDIVLTHGRADLDTLRCAHGRVVGFVDWEHAALADRHRDLAHAATAVASSLGPMLVPTFFDAYGARPDPVRLDWWALVDELVGSSDAARAPLDDQDPTSRVRPVEGGDPG